MLFYASIRGLADVQMYRNKPSQESRLRAPQFSIGLKSNSLHDGASAAFELEQLFSEAPKEVASAPAVVVKRRRSVDISSRQAEEVRATPADASPSSSEGRRPRVFQVKLRELPDAANVPEVAPQVASVVAVGDGDIGESDAVPRRAAHARRRVSELKRPGVVLVTRLDVGETVVDAKEVDVGPSEVQRDFDALSQMLEEMERRSGSFELDMTINARWAKVDSALASLKASVKPRKTR